MSGGNDSRQEMAATLDQVEAVRRRTRSTVHPAWFPLTLFGAFGLASTPFCAIGHGLGQGLFWAVAGPVGGILTARFYHRQAKTTGAGMRAGPYWAVAVGIFVGTWLAGTSGSPRVQTAGPMVAVALGYVVFGWLERCRPVVVGAAALGGLALAVGLIGVDHACVILSLAFGGVFTTTGLVLRRQTRG